jgi:uncharacterized membrane protein (UPF0127 family)
MNRRHALAATIVAVVIVAAGASAAIWWWGLPSDGGDGVGAVFDTEPEDTIFGCELADSPAEWTQGLSGREHLAEGRGMVFLFPSPSQQTFWMKDCLIPLDIIFVWANGTVGAIYEAPIEPGVADGDLALYESPGPVKWVVELNMGTCAASGITVGTEFWVGY